MNNTFNIKQYKINNHLSLRMVLMGIGIGIGLCIIVNPLTTSIYVNKLGRMMNLELMGENGRIRNKKTQKMLSDDAEQFKFIRDLSGAGVLPWLCVYPVPFPPLATAFSIYYGGKATYNGINYLLFDKSRVESGEFDENP